MYNAAVFHHSDHKDVFTGDMEDRAVLTDKKKVCGLDYEKWLRLILNIGWRYKVSVFFLTIN